MKRSTASVLAGIVAAIILSCVLELAMGLLIFQEIESFAKDPSAPRDDELNMQIAMNVYPYRVVMTLILFLGIGYLVQRLSKTRTITVPMIAGVLFLVLAYLLMFVSDSKVPLFTDWAALPFLKLIAVAIGAGAPIWWNAGRITKNGTSDGTAS